MISLDTETTGVDFYHGARPFFVTTCYEDGEQRWWEWDVDPLTRAVQVPKDDLSEIGAALGDADRLVLQNTKFDVAALDSIGVCGWPWAKIDDTLLGGHILASNQPHDLTSMVLHYLGKDISAYERRLEASCKESRKIAKKRSPAWRLAAPGLPDMPSIKAGGKRAEEKPWKNDSWLPKLLAKTLSFKEPATGCEHGWAKDMTGAADSDCWLCRCCKGHYFWLACQIYANADSAYTMALWLIMEPEIKRRGLWEIYKENTRVLESTWAIEHDGATLSGERLRELEQRFARVSAECSKDLTGLAATLDYDLALPKSGNNKSLLRFCFGTEPNPVKRPPGSDHEEWLQLPIMGWTEGGQPAFDKEAMVKYEATLPPDGKQHKFISTLRRKRRHDTANTYLAGYRRFWLPVTPRSKGSKKVMGDWYVLHSNLNPAGTVALRFSSNNPNSQNISGQEEVGIRYAFGPAPGREWWSLDGKNLELRLPAYESGEKDMIQLFERPADPPYFGSNHLLIAHILHPEKFEQCLKDGVSFKDRYRSSWYRRVKMGNFSISCGSVESSGTTDKAFGVPGAYRLIKQRMKNLTKLSDSLLAQAKKFGYVETMPDKTINPHRGYPIMCQRTEYGAVLPTTPFAYHVSGTAMWWMRKAMIRCHNQLKTWLLETGFDGFITLQVHDELVFDLPAGAASSKGPEPWRTNLPKMRKIQRLMEQGGDDLGVPTPVSLHYHPETYADGADL